MRPQVFVALLAYGVLLPGTAHGQEQTYRPLATWADPRVDAFLRWDALRSTGRPQFADLRQGGLLEDWFQYKRPRTLSTPKLARKLILRLASRNPNLLTGETAEALFQERNPDWTPVRNANAPQNDFTRPRPGGGRENLQVKFHRDGDPATYIADMKSDSGAHRFAVPDNHVEAVRARLNVQYYRLRAAGDLEGAGRAARNLGRLRGAGYSSQEVVVQRNADVARAAGKQYAAYLPLAASLILTLGPTAWDAATGRISSEAAVYRLTRTMSILGVGIGTDVLLQQIKGGALRGTLRGNVITGAAMEIADITWLLYEHGWRRSFNDPDFYQGVVGGITGLAVGTVTFAYVTAAASETGWWAPVIGFGASAVTGTVAYFGGSAATRKILEIVAPEMLREREREQLAAVKSGIERNIAQLQAWPPPSAR